MKQSRLLTFKERLLDSRELKKKLSLYVILFIVHTLNPKPIYIIDIEIDTGIASSPYKAGTGYQLGWFFDTKTNTN